jgi:short-subunit dehydrogenase
MSQTALITGATSGIGFEIAKNLANRGINLVLASRNMEMMNSIKTDFGTNIKIDICEINLTEINSPQILFDFCMNNSLEIDILVNNSGFGLFGKFDKMDYQQVSDLIKLNIHALTMLTYLFSKEMAKRKKGYILNVASTAAFQPIPYFEVYSASKSFVRNFSKALHYELKENGVIVTCLNPGPTKTNFFKVAMQGSTKSIFGKKPSMGADKVAEIGIEAMFSGKLDITAGWLNKLSSVFLPLVPLSIVQKYLEKFV